MAITYKLGLAFAILLPLGLNCLLAETQHEPSRIFETAIDEIRNKTDIPIMLPWKLPWLDNPEYIKLALGRIRDDGYFISLYYDEPGTGATYAAGFGASKNIYRDLSKRRVRIAGGVVAQFRPVSCGGSCAPANLWWEQNGVQYQIQIRFSSAEKEEVQQSILIETASSFVPVRKQ
jgi:hypothetical protein